MSIELSFFKDSKSESLYFFKLIYRIRINLIIKSFVSIYEAKRGYYLKFFSNLLLKNLKISDSHQPLQGDSFSFFNILVVTSTDAQEETKHADS